MLSKCLLDDRALNNIVVKVANEQKLESKETEYLVEIFVKACTNEQKNATYNSAEKYTYCVRMTVKMVTSTEKYYNFQMLKI